MTAEIVQRVRSSSRYRAVDAALVARLAAEELPKARNVDDAVKRVKRRLHQAVGAFRSARGEAGQVPELPEMQGFGEPGITAPPRRAGPITDWRPEDQDFWKAGGRAVARRNLWISTYCLLLSFAVWMVWSVVVAKLPAVGFKFTTNQLFWLAALPALCGATLRIFYSFMVPIFGGRLWTTLTTASLIVPAMGIGYAVQDPATPYFIFLVLALLCGLGGANFASSMANIGYFFPKAEKGNALALNAGLGNLGVSVMQFLVPLVITMASPLEPARRARWAAAFRSATSRSRIERSRATAGSTGAGRRSAAVPGRGE